MSVSNKTDELKKTVESIRKRVEKLKQKKWYRLHTTINIIGSDACHSIFEDPIEEIKQVEVEESRSDIYK